MENSPGGIQALGDVIINKRLIESLQLRVTLETPVPETDDTAAAVDYGLRGPLALFTAGGERFRFETDFNVHYERPSPTSKVLWLDYKPEDPSKILGREIDLLGDVTVLAIHISELLNTVRFHPTDGATLSVAVTLNGAPISRVTSSVPAGVLEKGQATFDVTDSFRGVPAAYRAATAKP